MRGDIQMEMPTPCQNCGEWFDLNDGVSSDKWYPGTVICERCGDIEEQELEIEESIEECENNIADAQFTLGEEKPRLEKLKEKLQQIQDKREDVR
jgi:uncharacterized coiled-coil protein SlyX